MSDRIAPKTTTRYMCRTADGRHFIRIELADGTKYVTPAYLTLEMAVADGRCWEAFRTVEAPKAEPKRLKFESRVCPRCEGERKNPAWGKVAGGWCFRCGGSGFFFTEAGEAARTAYDEAIAKVWRWVPFTSLKVGDRYSFTNGGKLRTLEDVESLTSPSLQATRVILAPAPGTNVQIWKDIAAQFPGAWLEY